MRRLFRNLPIRHKLMALTVGISGAALVFACVAFALTEQASFRRNLARDFALLAGMFGDNVAAGLAFNDVASIEQTLQALQASAHIEGACVYDKPGTIIGTYRRPGAGPGRALVFPAARPTGQQFGPERLDTFHRIALAGEEIGTLYIGTDLHELRQRTWYYVGFVSLLLVASSLVAWVLAARLQRLISGPILDLAQTVATVARDKDYAVRAAKPANDELGQLIDGFNEMLHQIQARDAALEGSRHELETRVDERTRELAKSLSLLNATLESTTDGIVAVDLAGRAISYNSKFAALWQFPPGVLARRDATEMRAHTATQVLDAPAFVRLTQESLAVPAAEKFDLVGLKDGRTFERYVFPQLVAGRSVGTVISWRDITARKRGEEELRSKTALLEAQLDSSIDGILIVDNEGRKIIQNKRLAVLWKIPDEIVRDADDRRQIEFVLDRARHPDQFAAKVRHLYAHPDESSQDEIEFKDGMVLDRYSAPVTGRDGKHYGRIWAFRDITERRRAEVELQKVHRELVEASRQAGMAEVATGVLHNVGNVLNSVNVSATIIHDQVRRTEAGQVAKLAALLDPQQADLAAFLTTDPRGRLIPGYLGTLAAALATEQQATLGELDQLRKNIDHIKEIVAVQQSYARASGLIAPVAVAEIVDDALRMNAGSFRSHGIEAIRDYQPQPVVSTDKHKVMQILINLIRNAKYACDDSGRKDKLVTLRTGSDGHTFTVAVTDNGIGIPAENLTRIFSHGFTTRQGGHGFGLHSGALAARELGGSLTAQSAGPGHGATFTLELPCEPARPRP